MNEVAKVADLAPFTRQQTFDFCRSEFDRTYISDVDLFRLCEEKSRVFQPNATLAASAIIKRVVQAIETQTPLSMTRVGNGEGNAVSMTKPVLRQPMVQTFYDEFLSQNHLPINLASAIAFSQDVRAALVNADIAGFRSFRGDEIELIQRHIANCNFYGALGVIYAREFLHDCLNAGLLVDKMVVSAWIHLDLIPHLEKLLTLSDRIIIVTGRDQLRAEFARRLGPRLADFIAVPAQGAKPKLIEDSHFCAAFPNVKRTLSRDLRGCLVLVGAGLFGKIYCDLAKASGAVALDIGSVFDVLSGLNTRPVFSRYRFAGASWV